MTDPIADMLTRIRNAQFAGHQTTNIPFSKFKFAIAEILRREGYLGAIERHNKKKELKLDLLYTAGAPAISDIRRISKPGKRIYRKWSELRPIRQGYGIAVVSTPRGLLTDKEARRMKVGGEVLFEVW